MNMFFKTYVSDTTAGSATQTLCSHGEKQCVGRVYYRLTHGGEEYALAYAGTVDATFADGSHTVRGDVCDVWHIHALRVGLCDGCAMDVPTEPSVWQDVTIDGKSSHTVAAGAWVTTDPIPLCAKAGQTLCVEMTFSGDGQIPCHEELQIPSFLSEGDGFVPSPFLPVPVMVGVKRTPSKRVAFLGDSITQGVGATPGTYRHWVARLAERSDPNAAYWNLGIGFARSGDAAYDGTWLYRAKQNDTVVVCFGVNDILRGVTADEILANIRTILQALQQAGCDVVLQSVPPFEFSAQQWTVWHDVNERIRALPTAYFDNTSFLCHGECPRYGGHPNDEGCAVWAETLGEWLSTQ